MARLSLKLRELNYSYSKTFHVQTLRHHILNRDLVKKPLNSPREREFFSCASGEKCSLVTEWEHTPLAEDCEAAFCKGKTALCEKFAQKQHWEIKGQEEIAHLSLVTPRPLPIRSQLWIPTSENRGHSLVQDICRQTPSRWTFRSSGRLPNARKTIKRKLGEKQRCTQLALTPDFSTILKQMIRNTSHS